MTHKDIKSLVRENVKKLTPYSSARDDFQGSGSVFLDANENPFNQPLNRYPDPHQVKLRKRIAELKGVSAEQIFLGNGSDEPIDLLIRSFCEPGRDNILIPQPTYGMYSVSAAVNAVEIKSVTLNADFDLDVQAIESAVDKNTKLLFLCSPNNPSGNLLSDGRVRQLLSSFSGLVVVDEAYIDFTNVSGFLRELDNYNNLVVLQTLSKAWGMAGIRLGMCFADPDIIRVLNRIKPPYNISTLTQSAALEGLRDEARKSHWVNEIKSQREVVKSLLLTITSVQAVYPSDANFLLVRVSDAKKTYQYLIAQGIVVRDRSNVVLCGNCLRITIGTEEENQKLIKALRLL